MLLNDNNLTLPSPTLHLHPQEDASQPGVPFCHYDGPYNAYSAADVKYTASGATADLTFRPRQRQAYEGPAPPIPSLRLEVKYHSDRLLQYKVTRDFPQRVLFRPSK